MRQHGAALTVGARIASAAGAVLIGAAIAWLLAYATGPDDYYLGGDVSRWEHAGSSGAHVVFVACVVVAAAAALALGARSLHLLLGRFDPGIVLPTLAAGAALVVGLFAVSLGH